ncbi:MAG TPA: amidohydrolase [Spirochaetota bacterium]|nr:amidohydrolase [Spirochaetota bacterium]
MQNLKVALVQTDLAWHDIEANIARFETLLAPLAGNADLVALPEMFSTGFTMTPWEVSEGMDGRAAAGLRRWARSLGAHVAGSAVIAEAGRYFNRLLWARPDGTISHYDKRHLFRMAGEDAVYAPGTRAPVMETAGWRIHPFICYDLRFPVWSRNVANAYDVALYVANWPAKRAHHWRALLAARAIENQCYVVGVNRVGTDGNGVAYCGDSMVIDFSGEIPLDAGDAEGVHVLELSYERLSEYRRSFPAWKDADPFTLG